jgi:hypothetical protein
MKLNKGAKNSGTQEQQNLSSALNFNRLTSATWISKTKAGQVLTKVRAIYTRRSNGIKEI